MQLNKKTIKIIQITDTHLTKDDSYLFDVNTNLTFKKIVDGIQKELDDTDAIFLTGDLSQDESKESYQLLADSFMGINKKIFWIPGNHDSIDTMETIFNHKTSFLRGKTLSTPWWDFIFLNTKLNGVDEGYLSDEEILFLTGELEKNRTNPIALVMHHNPIEVKTPLIDKYILKNNNVFLEIVKRYQVNLIICGHVHNDYSLNYDNIHIESAPASCFQFKKGATNLEIDYRIGYKVYYFSKDHYFSEARYWND